MKDRINMFGDGGEGLPTVDIDELPETLPILPLRNTVAFPGTVLPLAVGIQRSVALVQEASEKNRLVGLVAMRDSKIKEPMPGQTYEVGTLARLDHVQGTEEKGLQVIVRCLGRFRILHWVGDTPYLKAKVAPAPEETDEDLETDALFRSLRELAQEVVGLSPNFPKEAGEFLAQIKEPAYLVNLVATNAGMEVEQAQQLLEEDSVKEKTRRLIEHLSREKEVLSLGRKIQSEAKEKMSEAQREYYLRQQLKAIKEELGETDEATDQETEAPAETDKEGQA